MNMSHVFAVGKPHILPAALIGATIALLICLCSRREAVLRLTPAGRAILRKLALTHRTELERSGPELAKALNSVLPRSRRTTAS